MATPTYTLIDVINITSQVAYVEFTGLSGYDNYEMSIVNLGQSGGTTSTIDIVPSGATGDLRRQYFATTGSTPIGNTQNGQTNWGTYLSQNPSTYDPGQASLYRFTTTSGGFLAGLHDGGVVDYANSLFYHAMVAMNGENADWTSIKISAGYDLVAGTIKLWGITN